MKHPLNNISTVSRTGLKQPDKTGVEFNEQQDVDSSSVQDTEVSNGNSSMYSSQNIVSPNLR